MLLIRLLLTLMVVSAGWRFGFRGVFAVLLVAAALMVLLETGRRQREPDD